MLNKKTSLFLLDYVDILSEESNNLPDMIGAVFRCFAAPSEIGNWPSERLKVLREDEVFSLTSFPSGSW